MDGFTRIGQILGPHHLKGEVKFYFDDAFAEGIGIWDVLFLQIKGGKLIPHFVEHTKHHGVIKFEEIDDRTHAMKLNKAGIWIKDKELSKLPEKEEAPGPDQFIGFLLVDEHLGEIGEIVDVLEFPSQIMAFVKYEEREILIPLNEAFINNIELEDKTIRTSLPDGILDL